MLKNLFIVITNDPSFDAMIRVIVGYYFVLVALAPLTLTDRMQYCKDYKSYKDYCGRRAKRIKHYFMLATVVFIISFVVAVGIYCVIPYFKCAVCDSDLFYFYTSWPLSGISFMLLLSQGAFLKPKKDKKD